MKLSIPEKLLLQHLIVLGKTGKGKSSVLRHFVEHLLSQDKRVCIIDPKGDWYGLKLSADGRKPAFPVIAFGDFKDIKAQDIPINPQSGKHIAELVVNGNRPCVIGMRGWMPGAISKFWIDFSGAVFNSNSTGGLHLVIDEIQNFAPKERSGFGEENLALHWTKRLMSEGRGLGLVIMAASQRPQSVHNQVLTQCETLVAMGVIHESDRAAIELWVKGAGDKIAGKEVLNALAGLARGEAYVWSPENKFGPTRMTFPMFETFDSFAAPQLQKKITMKDWSSVDLAAVKEQLADVIQEVKQNDPGELKRQVASANKEIANLKLELAKKPAVANPTPAKIEIREVPVLTAEERKQLKSIEAAFSRLNEEISAQLKVLQGNLPHIQSIRKNLEQKLTASNSKALPSRTVGKKLNEPIVPVKPRTTPPISGDLPPAQQRILNAGAELMTIGVSPIPKVMLAAHSGQSPKSSCFANNLGALRTRGLLDYPQGGFVLITEGGLALAAPRQSFTLDSYHEKWLALMSPAQQNIMRHLISIHSQEISKEDLAAAIGQSATSSSFANNLGALRTMGAIVYPRQGFVRASDNLFLEGLK